jgi:hypothetical protein
VPPTTDEIISHQTGVKDPILAKQSAQYACGVENGTAPIDANNGSDFTALAAQDPRLADELYMVNAGSISPSEHNQLIQDYQIAQQMRNAGSDGPGQPGIPG